MVTALAKRLTQLSGLDWDTVRSFFRVRSSSPEEAAAFVDHVRVLNRLVLTVTGGVMVFLLLVTWPTDFFAVPPSQPEFFWLVRWRVVLLVLCTFCLLAPRLKPVANSPLPVAVAIFCLGTALSGYSMAGLGGLSNPFYYGVYSTPLMSVLLVVRLSRRFVITFAIVLCYFLAVWVGDASIFDHDLALAPVMWSCAAGFTSVAIGHIIYFLLHSNFQQRRSLDRRAKELEQLDQLKNDFFANVNHELRTPLANIMGAFRSIRRDEPDANRVRQLDAGLRSAARLHLLVNDLLELSRVDSGQARLNTTVVDLTLLVERVVEEFQMQAPARVTLASGNIRSRILVQADPVRLRTVLYNLLSNAFKFSPEDGRPVEVEIHDSESTAGVTVRDHGIGISPEEVPRIFDRFHQANGAGRRKSRDGLGIGLALVREIVEMHKGRVEVLSEPGKGTSMTVVIPKGEISGPVVDSVSISVPASNSAPLTLMALSSSSDSEFSTDAMPSNGDQPHVLVCEDNADLRAYLRNLLKPFYRVSCAADGVEGLRLALETTPDMIVTDIMMPGMSGVELVQAVRKNKSLDSVPCLFLTALTGDSTRVEALRAGGSDYIQKPFVEEELLARVQNLLRLHALTRNLDDMVRKQTEELRDLARNLASVQEGERVRIAREIHDESGQVLTGLRMELEHLSHLVLNGSAARVEEIREGFRRAETLVASTHASVDRMINSLRPSMLESRGFVSAITWLANECSQRFHVRTSVEIGIDEEDLSKPTAVALYRICQEALTNVGRHAEADQATVTLERCDNGLVLQISDNGNGRPPEPGQRLSFGLLGMKERARMLGGSCEIRSRSDQGTTVIISVPYAPVEAL